MFRYLFIAVLFIANIKVSSTQILPNIGQFQSALLYYNPAYAGSSTNLRLHLINRAQWVNIAGAPNTQMLTADAPISKNLGAGIVLSRNAFGDFQNFGFNLNVSYRVKLTKASFIQFGIKGGTQTLKNNFEDSFVWDSNDELLTGGYGQGTVPRIGFGVFYKIKKSYLGFAVPDLLYFDSKNVFSDPNTGKSLLRNNFVFDAGTELNLNEFVTFLPHMMLRYYPSRAMNYQVNLGFEFNQTFIAGLSVLDPSSLGIYAKVSVSPKLKLGYHYGFNYNQSTGLGKFATHEILISYGFD